MKAKLKLDKQAIQEFFLRHVEKLVLAVLVVVFLGLAYGAAIHPSYTHQPQELQNAAQRADENIEQIKQLVPPDWAKVNAYPEIAQRSRNAVSETTYVWRRPMDPRIWPEVPLRTEPSLFATEGLRGSAGVGAFLIKAGASGQQQEGRRWVVITGLVPAAKQVQAYAETFKDLKRPDSDTPRYIHFWVERAEVYGDARDANPNWVQINVLAARQIQSTWATAAQEVVAAPYIHDPLIFPLGPLMSASWGEQVAHPPEIPLASAAPSVAPQPAGTPRPQGPMPDVPQSDMPAAGPAKAADLPTPAPGAAAAAPAAVAAAPAAAAAPGIGGGAIGAGPGAPVAAAPGAEGTAASAEAQAHTADVLAVKHLLMRFFDFSVEPGKRYAYRVKLLLANPNYKCEVRYLSDPKLAEKTFIDTDWCDPCAPVFVPRDDRLLAGSVKLPVRVSGEPVATVTLVKWMMNRGEETSHVFQVTRGQLANLSSEGTALADTEAADATPAASLIDEKKPAEKSRKKESGPMITYQSDAILLDVRGGEKWPGRATEPGELLLLDYDGRLAVRDELDDQPLIPKPREIKEEVTLTAPAGEKKEDAKPAKSSLFGNAFEGEKKPKKEKATKKTK